MVVNVVLIVHPLSLLLGLVLCLLLVEPVRSLGLGKLVYLGGSEASNEFLSKSMIDRLACIILVSDIASIDAHGPTDPPCVGGLRRP